MQKSCVKKSRIFIFIPSWRIVHHIICSRATPLIYIIMNREKEEEEQTPIHYYGKGRGGTIVNNEVP